MNITSLKPNQVFVFGSNASGFHGAGAAGLACRGDSRNNWRNDKWFLEALKSPIESPKRIGFWAILGQAQGFQQGRTGMSYAIITVTKPGHRRSISLTSIRYHIGLMYEFAKIVPEYQFLCSPIGTGYAGYSLDEIDIQFTAIEDRPPNITLLWREDEWTSSISAKQIRGNMPSGYVSEEMK